MLLENLLLPILASGFVIISAHPYNHYSLYRYESQFLYLKTLESGVYTYLVVISGVLLSKLLLQSFFPIIAPISYLSKAIYGHTTGSQQENELFSFSITLLCFLSAWSWSLVAQYFLYKDNMAWERRHGSSIPKLLLLNKTIREGSMDKLLLDALIDKHPLLFTLQSKQLYVGLPVRLEAPSEKEGPNQEILILTLLSGYQDPSTHKPVFTHCPTEESKPDHRAAILLLRKEITQLGFFSFEAPEGNHPIASPESDPPTVR